jgi:hypothetical protein
LPATGKHAALTGPTIAFVPRPAGRPATARRRSDRVLVRVRLARCRTIGIARAVRIGVGGRAAAFVREQQRHPGQNVVAPWLLCEPEQARRSSPSRWCSWAIPSVPGGCAARVRLGGAMIFIFL